ncbi:hypothetical protein BCV71DRAFT_34157 [Rhizopus microsporus]|uniref:Uncharacterized protein n=1 Tax=Rhizopus microsporus TaxID=58291 RepID=A0A1X0SBZ7_RHIZD|nr:hypothetical protein BCV71DRAFT_34157 [Rhizopus microsporus]
MSLHRHQNLGYLNLLMKSTLSRSLPFRNAISTMLLTLLTTVNLIILNNSM